MAALGLTLAGCGGGIHAQGKTQQDTGPDQITVVSELDLNRFKPENPERFTIAQAAGRLAAAQLEVTGVYLWFRSCRAASSRSTPGSAMP